MKHVFDQTAAKFARSIDGTMRSGYYLRGKLFVDCAKTWLSTGAYVLDYGCGPGRLSLLLAEHGFKIRAVDTSPGMIAEARALQSHNATVEFETIAESREALPRDTYDGIVCSSVIEYIDDADRLLLEFREALRGSGALIISFANRASLFRWYWDRVAPPNPMGAAQHHVWVWKEFRSLLERNGFRAVTQPRYFEWAWDSRPLARVLQRVPLLGSIGVVVAKPT
jgi:SAM-dependent methyltransferase